jgi:MFS family permease
MAITDISGFEKILMGRRNLRALNVFTATSRLWFDGGLWVVYWQQRGLSLFEIGLLEALLHFVCVLSDVPIGIFADRYGWKLSLGLSALLGVVYSVVSIFTHTFMFAALHSRFAACKSL